jgi:NAD(P)H-flavin reductase/hemoglobin-like flavoprotein
MVAIALDGGKTESGSDRLAVQSARGRRGLAARFSPRAGALANQDPAADPAFTATNGAEIAPRAAESQGWTGEEAAASGGPAESFDPALVKESFARLQAEGPSVMEHFFDRLLTGSADARTLFPTMTGLRERIFDALTQLIWSLDCEPVSAAMLAQLGRDHRKFGVSERHHQAFFGALRDTVEYFIGAGWKADVAAAWQGALDYMSAQMQAAATASAEVNPAWWVAEIVSHELRAPGVAVLRLDPSEPLPYVAGQYVHVQVTRWPRVWRPYSIASAPRPGRLIELHVKAIPGGFVSNALVYHSGPGDTVLLGQPTGTMTLTRSGRDLLCIAGGTGLAPIKAIIEQVIARSARKGVNGDPKITLYFGARQQFDLYDLDDLELLEAACPGLRVIPVLSDDPSYGGLRGPLPEVVAEHASELLSTAEAYISGPTEMVSETAEMLAESIPTTRIHYDPLP